MGVGVKGRAALLPLAWPAPVPALPLLRGVAKPAKPVPRARAKWQSPELWQQPARVWDRKDSKRLLPTCQPGQRSLHCLGTG